jgi:DNA-binding transcriptional LysR family regulator
MPLAQRTCVPLSKALSYPIISLLRDSNVRQTINTYFSKLDVEFEPAFEATHHYTVGAMVEAGLGITLLPSVAVHHIKWSRNLKIVRLAESDFVRPVGLITRPGDSLSDMAENFRAFTLNVMKSLAAEKSFNVSRISDAPRSKQSKRNQVR